MPTVVPEEFNKSGLKTMEKDEAVTERCERKQSS